MTTMLEKAARAIAHSDYMDRLAVIEASQSTDRPISCPGPFDGMDYLIHESAWDGVDDEWKEPYRRQARAVLMAVREPDDAMIDAGLIAPHAMFEAALPHETFPLMIDAILKQEPAA